MRKRIMFVDDEPNILEGLKNRLFRQRKKWEMIFVGSGKEALAELAWEPVDVIVSDMRMPEMDGAALLKEIREKYPAVVRIVLSGHAELEASLRALPVSHQFLSKPCEAGIIEEVVERACNLQKLISNEVIKRMIGKLENLPPYPQTYSRLARGFAYLVAIIDWYSRRVLSWRISNSMEAVFCVDCLEDVLRTHGKPEIVNSDQGSQFTNDAFIDVLEREGIAISMDGRGRVFDNIFVERFWRNVKHEAVYLKGYATMGELMAGLAEYFTFYNGERPHQSLGFKTPDIVYQTGVGGGALIVDKYPRAVAETPVPLGSTGVSATAEPRSDATVKAKEGQLLPAAIEIKCAA